MREQTTEPLIPIKEHSELAKHALEPLPKRSRVLYVLCLFFFSIVFVYSITPGGVATSPDSIAYLEIAENIREGYGISRPDRSIEAFGSAIHVSETLWPPLYPAILAVVTDTYFNSLGIQFVSAVSLGFTMLLIFLILRRLASNLVALLLSLMYAMTVPVLLDYSYVWSETVYLALHALALWLIVNFLERDRSGDIRRRFFLIAIGLVIAALFYTRYVGIVATLILGFLFLMSGHRRSGMRYFFLAGTVCSVPIGYLLVRNMLLSESLTGAIRSESNLSLIDISGHVYETFNFVFLASQKESLICLAAGFLFIFVRYLRSSADVSEKASGSNSGTTGGQNVVLISASFLTLLYFIAIVAMRAVSDFDSVDIRLLSPAFPSFWVFLCALIFLSVPHRYGRMLVQTAGLALLLGSNLQGAKLYGYIRAHVSENTSFYYPRRSDYRRSNFTHMRNYGELSSLLTWNIAKPAILATKSPSIVEFFSTAKTVKLPRDFDESFIEELSSAAQPEAASLLLMQPSEADRFYRVMEDSERKYSIFNVAEGSLIVLGRDSGG